MIIAKMLDKKKLIIYLAILALVALCSLVLILGESMNYGFLPKEVSSFLNGREAAKNQLSGSLTPLRATILQSFKLQSLTSVSIEPIKPVIGQNNPFNESR